MREGQCAPQEASPRGTASYCHRPQPRLIRGQVPGAARSLAPLALTSRGRYPLLLIGTGGPHSVTATGRTPSPPRVGANEEPVARRRLTGIEQSRVLPGEQSSRITSSPRRCSMSRSSISTRAASSTAPAHRSPPAWRASTSEPMPMRSCW